MEGRRATVDLARDVARILLPPACVACGALLGRGEHGMVCGICWARVSALPAPRCDRCGHPLSPNRPTCAWCELLPPYVRAARSVCWATHGPGMSIVHSLKYGGWNRVAAEIAERMSRLTFPDDVIAERTALVPVPLAPRRERQRGFNQSALLAESLALRWRLPVWSSVLCRTRNTATQTRLTPGDRLRNVSGAFSAPENARNVLRGAHVVLVDDVVTTAATLNACAAAVCAGGARIVSFVTFARAPALGDRF